VFGLINRGDLPTAVEDEFENLTAGLRGFLLVAHNPDGTIRTADPSLAFVPVGVMMEWPTATAPTGWLLCDGSQVSRVTYNALFNVMGTTYGAGDGSTTFTLPDFRGKFALTKAASGTGSSLGSTGGSIDHTHTGGTISGSTGSASPTTDSQGSHAHGGSTGSGGDHSHGGSTGSSGPSTGTPSSSTNLSNSALGSDFSVADGNHTHSVNSHSHSISSSGSHSHTISNDGSHSHTVTSHSHTVGTLAIGATGSANPPYLVINKIIFAGV
jgi:microcystin-dependent protein